MYDVYTLSSVEYIYFMRKALKKAEALAVSGEDYLSRVNAPSANVGLMFMRIKGSDQVPLVVHMIPTPLCFLTGRFFFIFAAYSSSFKLIWFGNLAWQMLLSMGQPDKFLKI